MKIISPSVEILTPIDSDFVMKHLETCGRTCYASHDKNGEGTSETFLRNIIARGHESVVEHFSITVRFVCDRGVTHELVRHRIASFSQRSTRYCNYSKDKFNSEISVIKPCYLQDGTEAYEEWERACKCTERTYMYLLELGCKPEEARAVLPNSLATEICMTANIREWRTVLKQRTSAAAHPQIREIMVELLRQLKEKLPVLFEDIDG